MIRDLKTAIIDELRGGQTRSVVELVVDLAAPYEDVRPELEQLKNEGLLAVEEDDGQPVYRLEKGAVDRAVTLSSPAISH